MSILIYPYIVHKEIKASGLAKKANYLTLLRTVYIKT